MPYHTDWKGSFLCRKFSGKISSEEIVTATEELINDPRFDQLSIIISDYLDISEIDLSMREAIRLAHLCHAASKTNSRIKSGVLVTNETAQALASLVSYELEELNSPWENIYFNTWEEAKSWLQSLPNFDEEKFTSVLFPT